MTLPFRVPRGFNDAQHGTRLQAASDVGDEAVVAAYFSRRQRSSFPDPKLQRSRRIHRPPPREFNKLSEPPKDNDVCMAQWQHVWPSCVLTALWLAGREQTAGLSARRGELACLQLAQRPKLNLGGRNGARQDSAGECRCDSLRRHDSRVVCGLCSTQTLSFLKCLRTRCNVRTPFLIIAPLSTLPHWQREALAWTTLNTVVYHGNAESRELIRTWEMYKHDGQGAATKASRRELDVDVLVTTYVGRWR